MLSIPITGMVHLLPFLGCRVDLDYILNENHYIVLFPKADKPYSAKCNVVFSLKFQDQSNIQNRNNCRVYSRYAFLVQMYLVYKLMQIYHF